jgi:hypothetical protein
VILKVSTCVSTSRQGKGRPEGITTVR